MRDEYATRLTLLNRARKKNDPVAWDELIEFYESYASVIIRTLGVPEDHIDDVKQLVLLNLWQSLDQYDHSREKSKFRHWVAAISRNRAIDYLRKTSSQKHKIEKYKHEMVDDRENLFSNHKFDEIAEKEWELYLVDKALENVSKRFSGKAVDAFRLFTQGMTVNEISKKMNIPPISVYQYINRLKLRLIEEIQALKAEMDF